MDASANSTLPPASDSPQPGPWPPLSAFPIVAIGASAGGVEAIRTFFEHMPPDSGAAFVVIQHLPPGYKSLMPEILQASTAIKVREAEDGLRVEPNTIYSNISGKDLLIRDGVLRLAESDRPRGRRLSIDRFFRSLAEDRQGLIICILLSGTGSDGTLSLQEVKGSGGITIVQEGDARFNDMPQNAINSGQVDFILLADEMPAKILELIANRARLPQKADLPPEAPGPVPSAPFPNILWWIAFKTGHDFSRYKHDVIARRIERRMVLLRLQEAREYEEYLKRNDTELKTLLRELLIVATHFFRDPSAFEALAKSAIPQIVAGKSQSDAIRIWVPGCSTGEEAYSIAMLLAEHLNASSRMRKVRIFATDIDKDSLESARAGLYPQAIEAYVTPERLRRHFRKEGDACYRVVSSLKSMIVFAPHNLIKDPPFSHLDLISCRNVLRYLEADLQKKVLPLFHYALNPRGFLFLGPSESVAAYADRFAPISRTWKIFRRKEDTFTHLMNVPRFEKDLRHGREGTTPGEPEAYVRQAERLILRQFGPVGVIVDDQCAPHHFFGPADRYFRMRAAESAQGALLVGGDLRPHLMAAVRAAIQEGRQVRRNDLTLRMDGRTQRLDLVVTPLSEDATLGRLFLVLFEQAGWKDGRAARQKPCRPAEGRRMRPGRRRQARQPKPGRPWARFAAPKAPGPPGRGDTGKTRALQKRRASGLRRSRPGPLRPRNRRPGSGSRPRPGAKTRLSGRSCQWPGRSPHWPPGRRPRC